MARKIDVQLPTGLDLGGTWQVVWAAVSPSTGADVSGVTITESNVVATDLSGGGSSTDTSGPYMLVPGPGA